MVRAAAAELAGTSSDPALTDALVAALADPSDVVRANAASSLAHRGDSGAKAPLATLASSGAIATRLAALRALHTLGASDLLSTYADHPDPRIRRAARGL